MDHHIPPCVYAFLSFGEMFCQAILCGHHNTILYHWELKCVISLVGPGQKHHFCPNLGRKQSFGRNSSSWPGPSRMHTTLYSKWPRICLIRTAKDDATKYINQWSDWPDTNRNVVVPILYFYCCFPTWWGFSAMIFAVTSLISWLYIKLFVVIATLDSRIWGDLGWWLLRKGYPRHWSKGLFRSKIWLRSITWAKVGSEPSCNVILDSEIQGNNSDSEEQKVGKVRDHHPASMQVQKVWQDEEHGWLCLSMRPWTNTPETEISTTEHKNTYNTWEQGSTCDI